AALVGAVEGAHPGVARFELRTNTLVAGNVQFYERRGYHVTELVTVSGKIVLAQMAKDNDSATRPNGYSLLKLSHEQTVDIAQAHAPSNLAGRIAAEALPPPRVGQRALLRLADGKSPYWCAIFLIVRNADDVVVGSCCFKNEPQDGRVEIGYGIAPECRRQGAARAAVLTLLQLAGAASATAVLAQVNPENVASACVVRGAGFIDTGTREDELGETVTHWVARL
ncbi:MAG: GNAT family N-acetyltransferase, partial [Ramlibacter sp.]|nr:GNAT family N-acetyltransferase [Ramlibacter sp.]